MNAKTQASGLVLLVVLYLVCCRQRTLNTSSRKAFLRLFLSTVTCALVDIVSVITIENQADFPP